MGASYWIFSRFFSEFFCFEGWALIVIGLSRWCKQADLLI